MQANTATERQIKLIENLYEELRIRNTALYGGAAPAQLTKQRASEVIDVLTLRKLSSQLHRPVTADLTDPSQVREQLSRLEQLTDGHHTNHIRATAKRAEQLRKASQGPEAAERPGQHAAAPRVRLLPVRRRHEQPQPKAPLTAEQLAARAAELDRVKEPKLDASSRYSDVTGYGSTASYRSLEERSSREPAEPTDRQEHKIIELQDAGADATVSSTVAEASDYLDEAFAPPQQPRPTERQLAYLHKLERAAGKTEKELSHPGTRQGASRRIQYYLDAASRDMAELEDVTASMTLSAVASPNASGSVVAAAVATEGARYRPIHQLCGDNEPVDLSR